MARGNYTPEQVTAADIKVRKAERRIIITWNDGEVSSLDFTMLRKRCPCATCVSEASKRAESKELFPILTKDPGTSAPEPVDVKLMGHYALHIRWSDGHDTGIYDFRYLRSLDTGDTRA